MGTTPFVPQSRDTAYVQEKLPPARPWFATRPGETGGDPGPGATTAGGPDAGFALRRPRLSPALPGPGAADRGDVNAGATAVAMRRAAAGGRGPIAEDLEVAYLLTGVLEDAPGDWTVQGAEVARRIEGVRYDAHRSGEFAAGIDETWLEAKPAEIRRRLASDGPGTILLP